MDDSTDISLVHEQDFVRSFFNARHRDRWLNALADRKGRRKFLAFLDHGTHALNPRYAIDVGSCSTGEIAATLRKHGAGDACYVFSVWDEVDRRTMRIEDAVTTLVGHQMGSVALCIRGRLAFWEAEGPNDRFICFRKSTAIQ